MRILFLVSIVCIYAVHETNAWGSCGYKGKVYKTGAKFKDECNRCKCNFNPIKDFVTCTKKNCEEKCKFKDCESTKCPSISCPQGSHIPPGRCCPVCNMKLPNAMQMALPNKAVPTVCNGDICKMHCRYGHQKDNNGCNICDKCNMDPCYGYRCSGNTTCDVVNGTAGCQKCSQIMCEMYCQFGFQMDSNGCEICKCKTNPCMADPSPCPKSSATPVCVVQNNKAVCEKCPGICMMSCEYGLKTDSNDCPVCECRSNPCAQSECPYCVVENYKPVCQKCGPIRCSMFCQFGLEIDSDGCHICKCKDNPCMKMTCPPLHICEAQKDRACKKAHCPAIAKCKDHPALACVHPEKDATGNVKTCTGTKKVNCSDDFTCQMSRGHFPGVCCPLAQCSYFHRLYNINEIVPSLDGCNTCFCMGDGKIGCTAKACPKRGCAHNGNNYMHEESFPRGDGCNTCKCSDGDIDCTKSYCAHCEEDGLLYAIGEYVNRDDPCLICQCTNNPLDMASAKIVCAVKYSCTRA
ncbi:unnamed protein product [Owenia fusiformis]|uniref:Kielin/chordin-like protein n=1 Tax=Owenia fusiformis TaxID=6347 RepID=A0A8S4PXL9_OWEFU|nr:unnamed protein product [Owenia fusiformis]